MTKKLVDAVTDITIYDLGFTRDFVAIPLDEFIAKLQDINEELLNTNGWQDLQIYFGIDLGEYCDGDLEFNISGKRLETDKEEEKREKAEARAEALKKIKADTKLKNLAKKEVNELAELARLKAKYEDN